MSEVIRRGVIVIDLIGGKTEIPVPNLAPVLQARQQEVKLVDELVEATRRAWAETDKLTKAVTDAKAAEAVEQQTKHTLDLDSAQIKLADSLSKTAGGFLRLTRAAVLLGADSDKSFQAMIQGLAYVQAGLDVVQGLSQVVKSVAAAEAALTAVIAAQTPVVAANTAAVTANATAKAAAAAADAQVGAAIVATTAKYARAGAALLVVGAALKALYEAWDYFVETEAEAAEARENHIRQAEKLVSLMREEANLEREVAAVRREAMDPAAQADDLNYRGRFSQLSGQTIAGMGAGRDTEATYRQRAREQFSDAASDLKAERDLRKQILDTEIASRDEAIRKIQSQEKMVEAARKELDLEKEKVRAFQAQVGSLTSLQQDRLKDIRDKLLAGQDISKFEEEFLASKAGEQGRGIVDARRAKRGEAAGFGADFFKGIDGATNGLDDAAKALKEAVEQLKQLTGGATAAAKIAELEQEKAALNQKYQEFLKEWKSALDMLAAYMKENNERIAELQAAALANAG